MKICFVVDSYPGLFRVGGIAVYTQTAARALAQRGHEIHVLVVRRHDPPADTVDGPVRLHVRPVRWLPVVGDWLTGLGESIGVARHLARLHRQYRFDAVEFPNWEGIGLVGAWLPVTRTVVRLHTSMAESLEVSGKRPSVGDRFMMWAERTSARHAHRVVTHSLAHRDRLKKTYGLGEVTVIPHGIPLPEPTPGGGTAPESSPPMALTVGRLNARKGVHTLLKAIPLLFERAPNSELVFVGDSEDHPLARQFRAEHPLETRVRFAGPLDQPALDRLYSKCAVYFSPSIYESFGLTFVEAMARGKAVVGCDAAAIPELVHHEINGLLTPPNDPVALAGAIGRLLTEPGERERMGRAGEKLAREKYSMERMGAALERFFGEVVSRRAGTAAG